MINCLLIKVTNNSRGLPVRNYRTLNAAELMIGRSAECNIHLADPRIAMHHAVIKELEDSHIYIVSLNGEIEVDGAMLQNIKLIPGKQIKIGPYQLNVEPTPPDVNLSVSLTLVDPLPDDYQDLKARTHEPLPNAFRFKWRLSMWLVGFIISVFLILPLAQNLIPQLRTSMAELPFGFDRVWSPGRISTAHRHFGSECFHCHQTPLKKVSDQACVNCHQDTAPHIADPELQKRSLKAAHRFIGSMRCAECHQEHKSPHPLARQDNNMCIKCHGAIRTIDPNTKLPNIRDFEKQHPDFKLSFKTGPGAKDIERIPQSEQAKLIEKSGLKFPHNQHIGKVQGPNGIWDVRELSCTSCHQAEGKEMRFKALSFKNNCSTCHTSELKVGPKDNKLTLPHGDEQNMFNALKLYAPKEFDRYSEQLKNNGCAYCHEIQPQKAEDKLLWRVVPLQLNNDWMTKAQFNHAAHRTQQCSTCHQVEKSESSADVAIPNRQSCLHCHSGNTQKHKRIASTCMSCHTFHNAHQGYDFITGTNIESKDIDILNALSKKDQAH